MEAKLHDLKRDLKGSSQGERLAGRGSSGWRFGAPFALSGLLMAVVVGALILSSGLTVSATEGTSGSGRGDLVLVEAGTHITLDAGFSDMQTIQLISAWRKFARTVGPAKIACMDDLTVRADESGRWRAVYKIRAKRIDIKPSRFKPYAFVHELGHHLDFGCDASRSLGAEFREAQGLGDQSWFQTRSWKARPAEQFAEVLGEMVWGSRDEELGITVTDDAKQVVGSWLGYSTSRLPGSSIGTLDCGNGWAGGEICLDAPYAEIGGSLVQAGDPGWLNRSRLWAI